METFKIQKTVQVTVKLMYFDKSSSTLKPVPKNTVAQELKNGGYGFIYNGEFRVGNYYYDLPGYERPMAVTPRPKKSK